MEPQRRRAVAEQRVVKRLQGKRLALLLLVVLPQFQQSELAEAVHQIHRIECASLSLTPRARFLHERFVTEKPHALFHRPVFGMQPDADDESRETHQRFSELPKLDARRLAAEACFDHHLFAVMRPALDKRCRSKERRLAYFLFDAAQMLIVNEGTR